jgi:2-(1,2-epoxy-1,2-dihydrophenyl)acetyl-CoA isomerase
MDSTETSAQELVRYEVDAGVAVVTLNRPDRLNALTDQMMDELLPAVFQRANDDPLVRVIVLTGAGSNFCSGGDVQQRITAVQQRLRETITDRQHDLGEFVIPLLKAEKPNIAAVDGVVAGGGLALALACDIRVASADVRMCAPFIRRGLVPDGGLTASLRSAIGYAAAIDICLTGREVGAEEALRIGLVQRVWSKDQWWEKTLELARQIASAPSQATLLTKRALSSGRAASIAGALVGESWFQSICMRDPDFEEGVASFLEKREPRFRE